MASASQVRPSQPECATFNSAAFRKYDAAARKFPFAGFNVAVFFSIDFAE
jgi:hypothetical protein